MSNFGIRELKRQNRIKRRKQFRRRLMRAFFVLALIVSFVAFKMRQREDYTIDRSMDRRIAQAMKNEKIIVDSQSRDVVKEALDKGFEDVYIDEKLKINDEKYTDELQCYVKTVKELNCYSNPDENGKVIAVIAENSYVEFYGSENKYAKVRYDNEFYYVKSYGLSKLKDDKTLKVISGILYVNKDYPIPEDFDIPVDSTAKHAMDAMIEDMRRNGMTLKIASDKRGYELEKKLYDSKKEYADKPGFSEHQTGQAFDLYSDSRYSKSFKNSKEYQWLMNNSYKYGFILRYPESKVKITDHPYVMWHFRFVGVQNAVEMYENDLTLEEFLKIN